MTEPAPTIGLLHPGEMGAAIGAALTAAGHTVLWASYARSAASAARAREAGLQDAGTLPALRERADVILSVIPPAEAVTVAALVRGFTGIYVCANAVSPATADAVRAQIEAGSGRYVDGGIVGGPPRRLGDMRLYLSGVEAPRIAELFAGTPVDARVVSDRPCDASAIKMAYAGWTKGTAALLLAMREYAQRAGVEPVLLAEWAQSQPGLQDRYAAAARSADAKGWRWVGEMREIAAALGGEGLPSGFHEAAAEIFETGVSGSVSAADAVRASASADTG